MNDKYRVRAALRVAMLAGVATALVGCESIREAAGVEKTPPDEFAVVTKAPLVIPPDYNLKPPKPGAPPTNQSSPTDAAQIALTGTDPEAIKAGLPDTYSPEEKTVLANTGAASADHAIRQQIAADAKAMSTASDSFTDELLFRDKPNPDLGHPVDADTEHDRLASAKTAGQTPTEGQDANIDKKNGTEAATISRDGSGDKVDSDGGWFDGIF